VTGLEDAPAGPFVLTSVTHRVDDESGYTSEISSAPAVSPAYACEAEHPGVHLGTVSRVNDPAGAGRVLVTLDAFSSVETGWLPVVAAGAGSGKGLVMLPDVGDHVLVLAPGADLSRALVLGGLYGSAGPPDAGVDSGAVRRYTLRSPGGQVVRLDDAARSLRLEVSAGSYVELAPDRLTIHSSTDLDLHAPGRKITVTAAAVDFEEG
jgi:phage baseplate assembly protein V